MSDNNNGLFSKIKQTVTANHKQDANGQTVAKDEFSLFDRDPSAARTGALADYASTTDPIISSEDLEQKLKRAAAKRLKEQEQKFAEILQLEKKKYHKFLKEKYQAATKSLLDAKEQQLINKYQQEISNLKMQLLEQTNAAQLQNQQNSTELRLQIEKLQQELLLQQQLMPSKIAQAEAIARQEQEQISRNEILLQAEQKYRSDLAAKESELKHLHALELEQQAEIIMAEYADKLRTALTAQEHDLHRQYTEEITKQSELFDFRLQQEITAATQTMQTEFAREKQELSDYIASMRPDVEANLQRIRLEVEAELRVEFEREANVRKAEMSEQLAIFKAELERAKQMEIDTTLVSERQRLSEEVQQENMIVLKYKEREIRDTTTAELMLAKEQLKQLQEQEVQAAVMQQTQHLQREYQTKLAQATLSVQTEQDDKIKMAVIQERTRLIQQTTSEKKLLLQQQHEALAKEHAAQMQELAGKLNDRGFELSGKLAQREQELQTQQVAREQELKQIWATDKDREIAILETKLRQEFAQQLEQVKQLQTLTATSYSAEIFEQQKQAALQEQRAFLETQYTGQYANLLAQAQKEWEQKQTQVQATILQTERASAESRLRQEFQTILVEQRKQAAANFAKQRDEAIRAALAEFKVECMQELQADIDATLTNERAAMAADVKAEYEAKLQQELNMLQQEMDRREQVMLEEQDARIASLAAQHAAALARANDLNEDKLADIIEEEHKQLNLRFAQDKADLINELTERFNSEKQAAMNRSETELRDKLYKEMVKQKDHIQTKFSAAQEAALQEQKRRLEARHKQEIERVKQGYFAPATEHAKHEQIIAERGVEQLAERILAKFQENK